MRLNERNEFSQNHSGCRNNFRCYDMFNIGASLSSINIHIHHAIMKRKVDTDGILYLYKEH